MQKFVILKGKEDVLSKQVNEHMEKGYTLHGDTFVPAYSQLFYQVVVLPNKGGRPKATK